MYWVSVGFSVQININEKKGVEINPQTKMVMHSAAQTSNCFIPWAAKNPFMCQKKGKKILNATFRLFLMNLIAKKIILRLLQVGKIRVMRLAVSQYRMGLGPPSTDQRTGRSTAPRGLAPAQRVPRAKKKTRRKTSKLAQDQASLAFWLWGKQSER